MIDRCHCEQSEFFGRAASARASPRRSRESEDWAMALVAAGVGIAIVPEGVARGHPDVAVREIEVEVKREVGLAYSAPRAAVGCAEGFYREAAEASGASRRSAGAPAQSERRKS